MNKKQKKIKQATKILNRRTQWSVKPADIVDYAIKLLNEYDGQLVDYHCDKKSFDCVIYGERFRFISFGQNKGWHHMEWINAK